jgi:hypothetical protein
MLQRIREDPSIACSCPRARASSEPSAPRRDADLGGAERDAAVSEVSCSGCSTKCRWQFPSVGLVSLTETVAVERLVRDG